MEKNATILVVDDDKEIADLVEIYLVNDGYRVLKASDGNQCLDILAGHPEVRMLILDIMMPGIDGLEVCRRIRKTSNIPILMLSAKAEDMDKIVGFGTGADDYLTKPFHPLELLARVKSQMKRYTTLPMGEEEKEEKNDEIKVQNLTINKTAHVVKKDGHEVALTPIEFDILYLLASNRDRVFSTDEIFERVWNEKVYEVNNTVMVHIRRLREKIEDNSRSPKILKTVWGVGYKIESESV
ncbi:MAG: response regulator transcription factor [Eubacterium sp.]|nr:response regulator transcription factor [Eubacterium sp.]